jgi:hypothetical protein
MASTVMAVKTCESKPRVWAWNMAMEAAAALNAVPLAMANPSLGPSTRGVIPCAFKHSALLNTFGSLRLDGRKKKKKNEISVLRIVSSERRGVE